MNLNLPYYCFPAGLFLLINLCSYYIYKLKHPDNSTWIQFFIMIGLIIALPIIGFLGWRLVSWNKILRYKHNTSYSRITDTFKTDMARRIDSIPIDANWVDYKKISQDPLPEGFMINSVKGIPIEVSKDIKTDKNTSFYRALAKEFFGDQEKWREIYEVIFGYAKYIYTEKDTKTGEIIALNSNVFKDYKTYEEFKEAYLSGNFAEINLTRLFAHAIDKKIIIIGPDENSGKSGEAFHFFEKGWSNTGKSHVGNHLISNHLNDPDVKNLLEDQSQYIKLVLRKDFFQTFKIKLPKKSDSPLVQFLIKLKDYANKIRQETFTKKITVIPEDFIKELEDFRLKGFSTDQLEGTETDPDIYKSEMETVYRRIRQDRIDERLRIAQQNEEVFMREGKFNLEILWQNEEEYDSNFISNVVRIGKAIEEYKKKKAENIRLKDIEITYTDNIKTKLEKGRSILKDKPWLLGRANVKLTDYLRYLDIVSDSISSEPDRARKAKEELDEKTEEAKKSLEAAEKAVEAAEENFDEAKKKMDELWEKASDMEQEYREKRFLSPKNNDERMKNAEMEEAVKKTVRDAEKARRKFEEAERALRSKRDILAKAEEKYFKISGRKYEPDESDDDIFDRSKYP